LKTAFPPDATAIAALKRHPKNMTVLVAPIAIVETKSTLEMMILVPVTEKAVETDAPLDETRASSAVTPAILNAWGARFVNTSVVLTTSEFIFRFNADKICLSSSRNDC
jgi:uncharacterized membrane protein